MAADFQLLIGGEWVDGGDGAYEIVNPATEEVVGEAPNASVADAEAAAPRRPRRSRRGRRRRPEHRAELLEPGRRPARQAPRRTRAAGAGRDRRHHAGHQDDAGADGRASASVATPASAEPNIDPAAAGGDADHRARPRRHHRRDRLGAPVGVVACITSYNFPMTNMAGKLAPGAGHGQHRRGQAGAAGPAGRHPHGRGLRRGRLPARRRQRRHVGSGPEPAEALVASPTSTW